MDLIDALEGTHYIQYIKEIKRNIYSEKNDKKITLIRKPKNKINKRQP